MRSQLRVAGTFLSAMSALARTGPKAAADNRGNMHIFSTIDWKNIAEVHAQKDNANVEYIDTFQNLVAVAGEDAHVHLFRISVGDAAY